MEPAASEPREHPAPRAVRTRACCRVDLAGGTLDIWPLGLLHPGARTVNVAVDVEVSVHLAWREGGYGVSQGGERVEIERLEDLATRDDTALLGVLAEELGLPPFEAHTESSSPRGGGLGASSAIAVAFLAAAQELLEETGRGWEGSDVSAAARDRSPAGRAHLARDLEARLMGLPTGTQDHYPPLLGGALEILHAPGREEVRSLEVDLEALGEHMLVLFTGLSHFSAGQNWQVVRRRLEGEPEAKGLFTGIARVAEELPAALEAGDWQQVGELVGREWRYRRHLAPGVTTAEIDSLLDTARSLGVWGGKACGAGGGGCVVVFTPPEKREMVADRLQQTGGVELLPARPSSEPLRVERLGDPQSG